MKSVITKQITTINDLAEKTTSAACDDIDAALHGLQKIRMSMAASRNNTQYVYQRMRDTIVKIGVHTPEAKKMIGAYNKTLHASYDTANVIRVIDNALSSIRERQDDDI